MTSDQSVGHDGSRPRVFLAVVLQKVLALLNVSGVLHERQQQSGCHVIVETAEEDVQEEASGFDSSPSWSVGVLVRDQGGAALKVLV